jgi:hypothetical protein
LFIRGAGQALEDRPKGYMFAVSNVATVEGHSAVALHRSGVNQDTKGTAYGKVGEDGIGEREGKGWVKVERMCVLVGGRDVDVEEYCLFFFFSCLIR